MLEMAGVICRRLGQGPAAAYCCLLRLGIVVMYLVSLYLRRLREIKEQSENDDSVKALLRLMYYHFQQEHLSL